MIPFVWLGLFALTAVLGLLASLGLYWRIDSLVRLYHESWPKLIVAAARLGSGIFTVYSRSPAVSDQFGWNCAFVAAIVSWACWELVQVVGDSAVKQRTAETMELTRQIRLRTDLLVVLRDLVSGKRNRLAQTLESGSPMTAARIRAALSPGEHSYLVLDAFVFVLRALRPDLDHEGRTRQGFRIGLYGEENGVMTPILGYDSIHKARDPFSSHAKHAKHFKVSGRMEDSSVIAR